MSVEREVGLTTGAEEIRQTLKTDALIVLAGAGVSAAPPALCPTWIGLVQRVVEAGAAAHPRLAAFRSRIGEKWDVDAVKIERVVQLLHASLGTTVIDAFNMLVRGAPNDDHAAIASLAAAGGLRAVITTNFDYYIEEALDRSGVRFALHVGQPPRRLARSLRRGRAARMPLLKPHGSIIDAGSMAMTMRQVARRPGGALRELISAALRHHPVLVVGYSASDDDLFPLLAGEAPEARRVFWAVWGEVERNVSLFAARCPRCSIVRCRNESLLARLVDRRSRSYGPYGERSRDADLQRWAGGIAEARWVNFFCALLLMLDPSSPGSPLVLEHARAICRTTDDPLLTVPAHVNVARALLGGAAAPAQEATQTALQHCVIRGRPREYVELLAAAAGHVSIRREEVFGGSPLQKGALYAGNSWDAYLLGLWLYAAGVDFMDNGKPDAGRDYLLPAAGFLLRAGDMIVFRRCLARLADVSEHLNDSGLATLCRRQAVVLDETHHLVDDAEPSGRSPLLDRCEHAASRWLRKTITGELALGAFLGLVTGGLGALIAWNPVTAIPSFGYGFGGYVMGKVLGAMRIRRYPSIER